MFDFLFVFVFSRVFSRVFSGGTPCFFCQTFAQPSPGRVAVIRRGCPVFLHCMAWNVYSKARNLRSKPRNIEYRGIRRTSGAGSERKGRSHCAWRQAATGDKARMGVKKLPQFGIIQHLSVTSTRPLSIDLT